MKKLILKWWLAFTAKTPVLALALRNICAFIAIAIPVLEGSVVAASAPEWYGATKWYIMSISLVVGLIAQSQKKGETIK